MALRAENGAVLDFSSTAILQDVVVSAGNLSALSNTDYFNLDAGVPAPGAPPLLWGGLALVLARGLRKSR